MQTTIARTWKPVRLRFLAVLTVLALGLAPGAMGPTPASPSWTAQPVAAVRTAAEAVIGGVPGSVRLGRFGCLMCAGSFLLMGGGTVFGVAAAASAWPQAAAFCAAGCYQAFQ